MSWHEENWLWLRSASLTMCQARPGEARTLLTSSAWLINRVGLVKSRVCLLLGAADSGPSYDFCGLSVLECMHHGGDIL